MQNFKNSTNGRGNPAPTLTIRIFGAFETIRIHFIYVKVGTRFPRPCIVAAFSGSLPGEDSIIK